MDELLALQAQLAQLQEVSTVNKLSDRIIVDLVDKLQREYNLKVFHTVDGQTLITPSHLAKSIREQVRLMQRVNLAQLPNMLHVSIERIEQVVQKDLSDLTRVGDEILSTDYILDIIEQIHEELRTSQILQFSDIVNKHKLTLQFFKAKILPELNCTIREDRLTTQQYYELQKVKLRGVLRATCKPISLQQISKTYDIDVSCADEVVKELDGKITGGQFIPNKFIESRDAIVKGFFTQNNYVEYQLLNQLQIQKHKDYLNKCIGDVIFLESCALSQQFIDSLQAQISELLIQEGYTNLIDILPSILTDDDIERLFQLMRLDNCEYANNYIYSLAYLEKLTALFKDKLIDTIYQTPQKLLEQVPVVENDDIQASAGGKKKAPKKQAKQEQKKDNIYSQKEVFDHLMSVKAIDHDDGVPELYQFLVPRIQALYEQVKVDLFEKKKTQLMQLIQELQSKIQDMAIMLLLTHRSLEKVPQEVDTKLLVESLLYGHRLLLENAVVLCCKKFSVQLPQGLFVEQGTVPLEFGLHSVQRIFRSKQALSEAVGLLPKQFSKIFKEAVDNYAQKKLENLAKLQFLEYLNLKIVIEKKSEKGVIHFLKHQAKDLQQVLLYLLAEKSGLFFITSKDQRYLAVLQQLAHTTSTEKLKEAILKGEIEVILQEMKN